MQSMVHIIQGPLFHVETCLQKNKLDDIAIHRNYIQFAINNKKALYNTLCVICSAYDS